MMQRSANSNRARRSARSRGTSMIETVLILPFVFFLISLMFFFGKGMLRVQRVHMLSRYEAWRAANQAYVVDVEEEHQLYYHYWHSSHPDEEPLGPFYQEEFEAADQLNETFLNQGAQTITQLGGYVNSSGTSLGAGTAVSELIDALAVYPDAATFGEQMYAHNRHHHGLSFEVDYPEETLRLWQQFEGTINHSAGRHYHDWKLRNGYNVLVVDHSTISGWGYDRMSVLNNTDLRLENFSLASIAAERMVPADWIIDRGDRYEIWRYRLPHSGNWMPMRDVYLTDIDERLRAIDQNAMRVDQVFPGALVSWYSSYYGYSGPNVYRNWYGIWH